MQIPSEAKNQSIKKKASMNTYAKVETMGETKLEIWNISKMAE